MVGLRRKTLPVLGLLGFGVAGASDKMLVLHGLERISH